MKKTLCIALIAITTLSFVACGSNDKETGANDKNTGIENNIDKENPEEEAKPEDDKNEDKDPQTKPDDKEEVKPETKPDDKEETKPNSKPDTKPDNKPNPKPDVKPGTSEDKTERVFKISTKDVNDKVVSGGQVKTVGLGVAENISKILDTVSSKYFEGKGIKLTTIENKNGKKIAVVDLEGDDSYWSQKMQGSAGGQMTEYTLVENVLQKSYTGYWIDGVRFTQNGKAIQNGEHAPGLSETTYR